MPSSPDMLRTLREENIRLKDENQALKNDLAHLRNGFRALSNLQNKLDQITPQTDPFQLINQILNSALEAVNSQNGSLMLRDEENDELVFVHVLGPAQKKLTGYRLPRGEGIANWVVANRASRLVANVHLEPNFSPLVDQLTGFQTHSLICVPLTEGKRVLGAIEVVNKSSGESFTQEDLETMLLIAQLSTIAVIRAEDSTPAKG